MKIRILIFSALVALVPACSSSSSGGGSASGTTATGSSTTATTATGSSNSSASGSKGKVDCVKLKKDARQLLSAQLLAQLSTNNAITSIKSKSVGNLDVDEFAAAMADLHELDGRKTPFGDPKKALDSYQSAAAAAKLLLAKDPATQDDIDTYMKNVGTPGDFLKLQEPVAFALSDACG